MIKCPNCSGELDFDIKDQVVTCPYCDSKFNPKELKAPVKHATERKATEYDTGTTKGKCYTCSQCGAQLVTFDDTAVTFCNYCDSQALLESEMNYINPEVIIPFKKTKEECIELYKSKLNKALFAPNKFKNDVMVNKFRGIYMPYEIYDVSKHGPITAKGEVYSHRSGNYDIYDKFDINAKVDADYNGISFDISSSYSDDVSQSIPFNYKECEPFNHNYLIGFYADTRDVKDEIYDDNALEIGNDDIKSSIMKNKEFRKYGVNSVNPDASISNRKVGLFPVYFASFKNNKTNRIHYVVINGQTGKSAIDLPIDFFKYIIGTILIAIPIFFLMYIFTSLTAKSVCYISLGALLFAYIVQKSEVKKLIRKEYKLDDEGFQDKNVIEDNKKQKEKVKKKESDFFSNSVLGIFFVIVANIILGATGLEFCLLIAALLFPFLLIYIVVGLIVVHLKEKDPDIKDKVKKSKYKYIGRILVLTSLAPIITLVANPVSDLYYYGAGIFAFTMILLLFKSIINVHNSFMSRPLPQLNKRGGDMNE